VYEFGLGVDRNAERAFAYFERAARAGHLKAQVRAANCLFAGVGVARNAAAAFALYKSAATGGSSRAGSDDGSDANGNGSSGSRGLDEAMNQLGLLFLHGVGTAQDSTEALHWFQRASARGCGDATFNLAGMLAHGAGGVAADVPRANQLFALAREQGCVSGVVTFRSDRSDFL
jgi:TPR repeat protein